MLAVRMEGHVIDADHEEPISGAMVTTVEMYHPGRCARVAERASATANANGMFLL
jgi:hypothetical protein